MFKHFSLKNILHHDHFSKTIFFLLTSIVFIFFKLVGIYFSFHSFYGNDIFRFKNLSGYLWQDFFFFGVLFFLVFVSFKFKYLIVKILNNLIIYVALSTFFLSLLSFFFFRQNLNIIGLIHTMQDIGIIYLIYYIGGFFLFLFLVFIGFNILTHGIVKLIYKYKKVTKISTTGTIFLSYLFIICGILFYLIKGNLNYSESQNVFFNFVDTCFSTSDNQSKTNLNDLDPEQKVLYEQKLKALELAKGNPSEILNNLSHYISLVDDNGDNYIEELITKIAQIHPDIIIDQYQKISSIKDSYGNYIANKILEKAINKKSYPKYSSFFTPTIGKNQQPNIIIVLMESISAVDSKKVGGISDNLPLLDKIQSDGITYTNFLGNANSSEESHVATLRGIELIPFIKSNKSYYSLLKGYTDPLPSFANTFGYTTYFLSTVSIDFLGQREFLQDIGFKNIIGHETFSGKDKYSFDAAPDMDLYHKALEMVDQQNGKYFITMQTISTHEPYYTPYGISEKESLRYFDESLYAFYTGLQQRHFFDNGILILVSDHRKRSEITKEEVDKFGGNADARILLSVIGSGIQKGKTNDQLYQHIDIFYSIKKLIGNGTFNTLKYYNDIFDTTIHRNRGLKESGLGKKFVVLNTGKDISIMNIDENSIKFQDTVQDTNSDLILQYTNSLLEFERNIFNETNTQHHLKIIAHRGYSSLYLDNTLEAFYKALRVGVDGIEFDVSYTKDGENIVIHGPGMEQTTCGKKTLVKNISLDIAKKCELLNKEELLTLDEFLEKTKTRFEFYFLEIKVDDTSKAKEQTVKAIESVFKAGLQDKVIFTSYDGTAKYIISSYNGIKSARDTFDVSDLKFLNNTNHEVFMAPYDKLTTEIVQTAKSLGKTVVTYTVNDTGTAQKMYNLGVDMVMTDEVELLKNRWYETYK